MIYCLYHKSCIDGFAAAYCVWRLHPDAKFIPVQYGEKFPIEPENDDIVFIVDFSYSREILESLNCDLRIIDHHKTAQKDLEGFNPNAGYVHFDMNYSGCVLTWKNLFPNIYYPFAREVPKLLEYIEDRDLGRIFQGTSILVGSNEINAALQNKDLYLDKGIEDFQYFDSLVNGPNTIQSLHEEGELLLGFINKKVKSLANKAIFEVDESGNKYALINSPLFQSEIGNYLVNKFDDIQYAAIYFDNLQNNQKIYSLRSRPDFDVSVIAKENGGGGHPQAAGYSVKLNRS